MINFGTRCLCISFLSVLTLLSASSTAWAQGSGDIGACCLVSGNCVDATQDECLAQDGAYQGDGITCGQVFCPALKGACCFDGGGCVRLREVSCDSLEGSYSGDGTECASGICGNGCPGDVNGDGVVNVTDEIAIITNWGPCPGCPEDINGDGEVDVADLIVVIVNWGDCPTGACCLPGAACQQLSQAECLSNSAAFYYGDLLPVHRT